MKKLLALSILATLVSCGGKSGGSKTDPAVQFFQEALESQKVGMVQLNQNSGTRHKIEANFQDKVYTAN